MNAETIMNVETNFECGNQKPKILNLIRHFLWSYEAHNWSNGIATLYSFHFFFYFSMAKLLLLMYNTLVWKICDRYIEVDSIMKELYTLRQNIRIIEPSWTGVLANKTYKLATVTFPTILTNPVQFCGKYP